MEFKKPRAHKPTRRNGFATRQEYCYDVVVAYAESKSAQEMTRVSLKDLGDRLHTVFPCADAYFACLLYFLGFKAKVAEYAQMEDAQYEKALQLYNKYHSLMTAEDPDTDAADKEREERRGSTQCGGCRSYMWGLAWIRETTNWRELRCLHCYSRSNISEG